MASRSASQDRARFSRSLPRLWSVCLASEGFPGRSEGSSSRRMHRRTRGSGARKPFQLAGVWSLLLAGRRSTCLFPRAVPAIFIACAKSGSVGCSYANQLRHSGTEKLSGFAAVLPSRTRTVLEIFAAQQPERSVPNACRFFRLFLNHALALDRHVDPLVREFHKPIPHAVALGSACHRQAFVGLREEINDLLHSVPRKAGNIDTPTGHKRRAFIHVAF